MCNWIQTKVVCALPLAMEDRLQRMQSGCRSSSSVAMPSWALGYIDLSGYMRSRTVPADHKGLVEVIDGTAHIENLLNQVIEGYCGPRRARFDFFWTVLLDSSIMPLGSKVRAVSAIAQDLKSRFDPGPLHKVLPLRNAFAHNSTTSHPLFVVGKIPEENSAHYQFSVITHSGKVTRTKRETAIEEFRVAYAASKASLGLLIAKVKEKNPADAT